VMLLDEPFQGVDVGARAEIHAKIRELAGEGTGIIVISSDNEELPRVCDTVVVFRDGNSVWSGPTSELTEASLVELMLGRKPETFGASPDRTQANVGGAQSPALRLSRVSVGGVHVPLDMYVMPGEVVGFAGLAGSGRVELMRALSGDTRLLSGRVLVKGKEAALTSPHSAIASGLFSLGEDRKQEGILPHLDVTENTMISRRRKLLRGAERFMTLPAVELAQFDRLRQRMNIKVPNGRVLIGNLSGGNQQKAMLGRAASTQCGVLLLNEPTRGVDVGAKVEIYKLIRLLADDGAAVVVSSSDVPELVALVDRCVVFCDGRVVAELSRPNITENTIVAASLGQDLVEVAHA